MKALKIFLLIFLLADAGYTYLESYHMSLLDGDMAGIILADDSYKHVIEDPLALDVLLNKESYPATNRFFIHWFMSTYYKVAPNFFQLFTDPVDSIYVSMAFIRTLIQILIIYLLSVLASGKRNIFDMDFLIAAIVITPVFQISGYKNTMQITIDSPTYTFFYALPFIFLLLYSLPFVRSFTNNKYRFGLFTNIALIVLAFVIALGGPLLPAILLIICPFAMTGLFIHNFRQLTSGRFAEKFLESIRRIPKPVLFHFIFISALCLYSLYVGSFNSENAWSVKSLEERYDLLPTGFWKIISEKLGIPTLFIFCVLNTALIFISGAERRMYFVKLLLCGVIFSLIYLALLPLGGYRFYRPFIIRFDTFSPVLICLMFIAASTSIFFLKHVKKKFSPLYILILVTYIFIFTNADRIKWRQNECERQGLYELVSSKDKIVFLDTPCVVFSWGKITEPQMTESRIRLLKRWNVLQDDKLYYQKENPD
jgi:hypothetical protein